jgi:hypothetical protein
MERLQQNVRDAAVSMIERYGRSALQQVDQRIHELRELREDEAVLLWQEIRIAVENLLSDHKNGKSHRQG